MGRTRKSNKRTVGDQLRLVNKTTEVPPGGWHWVCPTTGTIVRASCWVDLVHNVNKHVAGCKKCPDVLPNQIEQQICERVGRGLCNDDNGAPVFTEPAKALTVSQVLTFTRTLISWFREGNKLVSQATAEKRAKICTSCPLNQDLTNCTGCAMKPIRNAVSLLRGKRRTSLDSALRICQACGCSLEVKVWFPKGVLKENMPSTN